LVGLPSGTASEAAFATATEPTKNAVVSITQRRESARTSGTISTTAPSRETTQVRSAEAAQTSA
jgi:hypothetical protein